MAFQPFSGSGSGSGSGSSSNSGFQFFNSPFGDTTYTKVFVGGLAWETQSETMRRYFEQFGDILEAVVITDKNTGRSKGYGFVSCLLFFFLICDFDDILCACDVPPMAIFFEFCGRNHVPHWARWTERKVLFENNYSGEKWRLA